MAESSYPNPSVTQIQHERLMGRAMPDGVIGHPSDLPVVYANGTGTREVRIRADKQAVVAGYGWQNDAAEVTKALAANSSGSTRIDLVVLRYSRADYSVTVQVVQGTPGAGAPSTTNTIGTSGVWEFPLAAVTVASGATTLASTTVSNRAWYVNEDGQILCKSTARPFNHPGRTAFETDTNRWIRSDGTTWTSTIDDSGRSAVVMSSGYAADENSLQRVNGVCVLNIQVRRTNGIIPPNALTKVGTLPAGFWPTFNVQGVGLYSSSAGSAIGLRVTDAGSLYVVTPPTVDIDQNRTVDGSLTWHAA